MSILAGLIPVAVNFLPDLARWIAGDKVGDVADKAEAVVRAVTGADTREGAEAALADPDMAARLRIELAKITNEQEAARQAAETERLRLQVGDLANTRAMGESNKLIAYTQVALAGAIWATFGACLVALLTNAVNEGNAVVLTLLGVLASSVNNVTNFFFGASTSSHSANSLLARMVAPFKKGASGS